jgi:hypothetical protein
VSDFGVSLFLICVGHFLSNGGIAGNDERERKWKEAVYGPAFIWMECGKQQNFSLYVASFRLEIRTQELSNTKQISNHTGVTFGVLK